VILDTIAPIIPHLRHVSIDETRLHETCLHVQPNTLQLPTWDEDVFIAHPPEARAAQILLFNAVNFSYWGSPKWTIEFHGRPEDGAWGMLGSIVRAVQDDGFPLFDGAYLSGIPASDLRHILRGNVEIPMFRQRLGILHETGRVLVAQFDGEFVNLIRAAKHDAVTLVQLLVSRFPSFNDVSTLHAPAASGATEEVTTAFYKRAQLAAAMLYEAFGGEGLGNLHLTEEMTVFADYKLPQVLRRLGILRYAPHLADRVDRLEPLEAGSREEVEIRAATVWAAELMRQELLPRFPEVTALHIDYWLWHEGQIQGPGIQPYHRVRSIYY
jgi:hypothetical protein